MRLRYLFTVFALLFVAGTAWGTCTPTGYTYTKTVDVYDNTTAGHSPTTVYRVVDIAGTATMTPTNCAPQQAKHFAKAYNQLNGGGGWTTGAQVCVTCYTSVHSVQTVAYADNWTGTTSDAGNVNCTVAGLFFNMPNENGRSEFAKVQVHNLLIAGDVPNSWLVETYCSGSTTPPDFHPTYVTDHSPAPLGHAYYRGASWCWRAPDTAGTAWSCDRPTLKVYYVAAGDPKPDCTRRDVGNFGFLFDWSAFAFQTAVQLYYDFHGYVN